MSDIRDDIQEAADCGAGIAPDSVPDVLAEIDRLRTELQQHQWRSIESAPKGWPFDKVVRENIAMLCRDEAHECWNDDSEVGMPRDEKTATALEALAEWLESEPPEPGQ